MNLPASDQTPSPQARVSQTTEFEDYDSTSRNYNQTRVPLGLPVILGHLASTSVGLDEQTVLDAGCGTGNYLAALSGRVGALHGLELNEGMFRVAHKRFADDPGVQVASGNIAATPYADESFDGVICNQVLHHLVLPGDAGNGGADLSNVVAFTHEAFRLLRPGGVVVINTSSHGQTRDGFWWGALIPEAVERILQRIPPVDWLENSLREAGFVNVDIVVPLTAVLQGERYLDPTGPLSTEWRAGDSTWSLATESELAQALDNVKAWLEDGRMTGFLAERERRRVAVGQTTFLAARKPF